ncbi:MAG: hypothetical protein DIAAKJNI_00220 [Candidatus Argoarchaeum ethanivorans]|uniref:Uncharacterized protein n=1 Tax=Candidatus Argoarchaeum ethanivorans TaxID=2608793 RepID=A0A811T4G8_9EURY|nr:MAG: hypothetical protein DIAAKJNI_00195 [Candidatus Argoarchaeum ethanivorans]CAD6492100.1 MAG: hypothetical protein DIAAKJNI_00220 [Candidatus Argoarchaeum ethanivorans]
MQNKNAGYGWKVMQKMPQHSESRNNIEPVHNLGSVPQPLKWERLSD